MADMYICEPEVADIRWTIDLLNNDWSPMSEKVSTIN